MSQTKLSLWVAILIGVSCSGGLISVGPPTEAELSSLSASNGLVVISSEEDWDQTAAILTEAIAAAYPQGIEIGGPLPITLPSTMGRAILEPSLHWTR